MTKKLENIRNFAVFAFLKKSIFLEEKVLLVMDKGKFKERKYKMPGGMPDKILKDCTRENFIKYTLQKKVYFETNLIILPDEFIFKKEINKHFFIVMTAKTDSSSPELKSKNGIVGAKWFSLAQVMRMIDSGDVLENHALAITAHFKSIKQRQKGLR